MALESYRHLLDNNNELTPFGHRWLVSDYSIEHPEEGPLTLKILLPGFNKEEVEVYVTDKLFLNVKARSRDKKEFFESFRLSKYVDLDKIKAKLENGYLYVQLPMLNREHKVVQIE